MLFLTQNNKKININLISCKYCMLIPFLSVIEIVLLEVMELTYDRKLCLIESLRRCNLSAIEIHNIVETAWPNKAGTVRSIQKVVWKVSKMDNEQVLTELKDKENQPVLWEVKV